METWQKQKEDLERKKEEGLRRREGVGKYADFEM